ncbi:putative 20S-pre-rRNA D-site endonuclease nob1 [Blattamonas nauphoetae]|uniref:20S-pre-rRNA D-site endonuclease nob1 n=1 Tax=Blattamonas nauphoetae TaxID=2049346 RepID=A0ABQ9XM09_9EUKA|nr:putative 20S-pre-rRNA D-site endonuclease nob1 [Blattamonas nauphoetae]
MITYVLDTAAFIENFTPNFLTDKAFVTPGIVPEIKDARARERFELWKENIIIQAPSKEGIQLVKRFAEKSGDLSFLSTVDIGIIALAYDLEITQNGTKNIHSEPKPLTYSNVIRRYGGRRSSNEDEKEEDSSEEEEEEEMDENEGEEEGEDEWNTVEPNKSTISAPPEPSSRHGRKKKTTTAVSYQIDLDTPEEEIGEFTKLKSEIDPAKEEESMIEESDEDESVDGEWITADNLHQLQGSYQLSTNEETKPEGVCLVSADLAVQNVACQIGLQIVAASPTAPLIKSIRRFLLYCGTCQTLVNDTTKIFCPNCGLHGLRRVTCSIDASTGELTIYLRRRPANIRGNQYSIPLPKGGRGGRPIVLREDVYHERVKKTRKRLGHKQSRQDLEEDEIPVFASEVKKKQTDVVNFGLGRRNPNAPKGSHPSKKRHGKR